MKKFGVALLLAGFSLYGCASTSLGPEVVEERNKIILAITSEDIPFLVDQCVNVFVNGGQLDDEEFKRLRYLNTAVLADKVKRFKVSYPGLGFGDESIAFDAKNNQCIFRFGRLLGLEVYANAFDRSFQRNGFVKNTEKRLIKRGFIYDVNGSQVVFLGKEITGSTVALMEFKLRPRVTSNN